MNILGFYDLMFWIPTSTGADAESLRITIATVAVEQPEKRAAQVKSGVEITAPKTSKQPASFGWIKKIHHNLQ